MNNFTFRLSTLTEIIFDTRVNNIWVSHLVLEDQVFPQAAEALGEGEQGLVAERLPVVLHHHHPASQLRTFNMAAPSLKLHPLPPSFKQLI